MRCISASTCKTSSRRPASGRRPGWIACCRASCASSRTTRRVPCSPASLHRIPLTTVPAGGSAISRVGIARRGRACRRARSISFHRSLASSRPRRSSTSRRLLCEPPAILPRKKGNQQPRRLGVGDGCLRAGDGARCCRPWVPRGRGRGRSLQLVRPGPRRLDDPLRTRFTDQIELLGLEEVIRLWREAP